MLWTKKLSHVLKTSRYLFDFRHLFPFMDVQIWMDENDVFAEPFVVNGCLVVLKYWLNSRLKIRVVEKCCVLYEVVKDQSPSWEINHLLIFVWHLLVLICGNTRHSFRRKNIRSETRNFFFYYTLFFRLLLLIMNSVDWSVLNAGECE